MYKKMLILLFSIGSKKKTTKEASCTFHCIMPSSVKSNLINSQIKKFNMDDNKVWYQIFEQYPQPNAKVPDSGDRIFVRDKNTKVNEEYTFQKFDDVHFFVKGSNSDLSILISSNSEWSY
jgi:hypothetical protein